MRRFVYITAFTFLGILLSSLVHFVVEILVISLLTSDFSKWGLGLSWDQWYSIHKYGTIILLIAGIFFGFQQGRHWWQYIYVDKKLKRRGY